MAKFNVSGTVTVSCWTVVEADTEEQARKIAMQRGLAPLCHQPFGCDDDEAWHLETDGEPEIVEVVDE